MNELSELLKLHDELDNMFFAHQRALLHFEFDDAAAKLENYESALLKHMKDEEEVLMPFYVERAAPIKGGNPLLFLDEHIKMRRFIELFMAKTVELADGPNPEAGLILLLDREAFYKRLCSHHDRRESEVFYPELDRITSNSEKLELLGRVNLTFSQSRAAHTTK
jgi:hemerythrin-like domain-containing protein